MDMRHGRVKRREAVVCSNRLPAKCCMQLLWHVVVVALLAKRLHCLYLLTLHCLSRRLSSHSWHWGGSTRCIAPYLRGWDCCWTSCWLLVAIFCCCSLDCCCYSLQVCCLWPTCANSQLFCCLACFIQL